MVSAQSRARRSGEPFVRSIYASCLLHVRLCPPGGFADLGLSPIISFDDWGMDVSVLPPLSYLLVYAPDTSSPTHRQVVIGAPQKGIGAPPGLSITVASEKAISTFQNRKSKVPAYYISWAKWLPIMKSYENLPAAYFATRA